MQCTCAVLYLGLCNWNYRTDVSWHGGKYRSLPYLPTYLPTYLGTLLVQQEVDICGGRHCSTAALDGAASLPLAPDGCDSSPLDHRPTVRKRKQPALHAARSCDVAVGRLRSGQVRSGQARFRLERDGWRGRGVERSRGRWRGQPVLLCSVLLCSALFCAALRCALLLPRGAEAQRRQARAPPRTPLRLAGNLLKGPLGIPVTPLSLPSPSPPNATPVLLPARAPALSPTAQSHPIPSHPIARPALTWTTVLMLTTFKSPLPRYEEHACSSLPPLPPLPPPPPPPD